MNGERMATNSQSSKVSKYLAKMEGRAKADRKKAIFSLPTSEDIINASKNNIMQSIRNSINQTSQQRQSSPFKTTPSKEIVLTLRDNVDKRSFHYLSNAEEYKDHNPYANSKYLTSQEKLKSLNSDIAMKFVDKTKTSRSNNFPIDSNNLESRRNFITPEKYQSSIRSSNRGYYVLPEHKKNALMSIEDLNEGTFLSVELNHNDANIIDFTNNNSIKSSGKSERNISKGISSSQRDPLTSFYAEIMSPIENYPVKSIQKSKSSDIQSARTYTNSNNDVNVDKYAKSSNQYVSASMKHDDIRNLKSNNSQRDSTDPETKQADHTHRPNEGLRALLQTLKQKESDSKLLSSESSNERKPTTAIGKIKEEMIEKLIVARQDSAMDNDHDNDTEPLNANLAMSILLAVQKWLSGSNRMALRSSRYDDSNGFHSRGLRLFIHLKKLPKFVTEYYRHESWLRDKMESLCRSQALLDIYREWMGFTGVSVTARVFHTKTLYRRGLTALYQLILREKRRRNIYRKIYEHHLNFPAEDDSFSFDGRTIDTASISRSLIESPMLSYQRRGCISSLLRYDSNVLSIVMNSQLSVVKSRREIDVDIQNRVAKMFSFRKLYHRTIYYKLYRQLLARHHMHLKRKIWKGMLQVKQNGIYLDHKHDRLIEKLEGIQTRRKLYKSFHRLIGNILREKQLRNYYQSYRRKILSSKQGLMAINLIRQPIVYKCFKAMFVYYNRKGFLPEMKEKYDQYHRKRLCKIEFRKFYDRCKELSRQRRMVNGSLITNYSREEVTSNIAKNGYYNSVYVKYLRQTLLRRQAMLHDAAMIDERISAGGLSTGKSSQSTPQRESKASSKDIIEKCGLFVNIHSLLRRWYRYVFSKYRVYMAKVDLQYVEYLKLQRLVVVKRLLSKIPLDNEEYDTRMRALRFNHLSSVTTPNNRINERDYGSRFQYRDIRGSKDVRSLIVSTQSNAFTWKRKLILQSYDLDSILSVTADKTITSNQKETYRQLQQSILQKSSKIQVKTHPHILSNNTIYDNIPRSYASNSSAMVSCFFRRWHRRHSRMNHCKTIIKSSIRIPDTIATLDGNYYDLEYISDANNDSFRPYHMESQSNRYQGQYALNRLPIMKRYRRLCLAALTAWHQRALLWRTSRLQRLTALDSFINIYRKSSRVKHQANRGPYEHQNNPLGLNRIIDHNHCVVRAVEKVLLRLHYKSERVSPKAKGQDGQSQKLSKSMLLECYDSQSSDLACHFWKVHNVLLSDMLAFHQRLSQYSHVIRQFKRSRTISQQQKAIGLTIPTVRHQQLSKYLHRWKEQYHWKRCHNIISAKYRHKHIYGPILRLMKVQRVVSRQQYHIKRRIYSYMKNSYATSKIMKCVTAIYLKTLSSPFHHWKESMRQSQEKLDYFESHLNHNLMRNSWMLWKSMSQAVRYHRRRKCHHAMGLLKMYRLQRSQYKLKFAANSRVSGGKIRCRQLFHRWIYLTKYSKVQKLFNNLLIMSLNKGKLVKAMISYMMFSSRKSQRKQSMLEPRIHRLLLINHRLHQSIKAVRPNLPKTISLSMQQSQVSHSLEEMITTTSDNRKAQKPQRKKSVVRLSGMDEDSKAASLVSEDSRPSFRTPQYRYGKQRVSDQIAEFYDTWAPLRRGHQSRMKYLFKKWLEYVKKRISSTHLYYSVPFKLIGQRNAFKLFYLYTLYRRKNRQTQRRRIKQLYFKRYIQYMERLNHLRNIMMITSSFNGGDVRLSIQVNRYRPTHFEESQDKLAYLSENQTKFTKTILFKKFHIQRLLERWRRRSRGLQTLNFNLFNSIRYWKARNISKYFLILKGKSLRGRNSEERPSQIDGRSIVRSKWRDLLLNSKLSGPHKTFRPNRVDTNGNEESNTSSRLQYGTTSYRKNK